MLKSTKTYQQLTKISAILLLLAFLIPSGLQAKQLVDFCMMEMGHNETTEMAVDHSCCTEETPTHHKNEHAQHDCDFLGICACDIGNSMLSDSQWTIASNEFSAILSRQFDLTPFITFDESINSVLDHQLRQNSPPLWLLYDTLII